MSDERTPAPYEGLPTTFDTVAELYERARPGYPAELFDELAALIGGGTGDVRVLEIGPGTGQATRGLLARGWRVVALEPGAELAAVARRVLAGIGDLEMHVTRKAAYEAVGMSDGSQGPLPPEAIEAPDVDAMVADGCFDQTVTRRFLSELTYTADAYEAVLNTYSNHIAESPDRRARLFADIRLRIGERPGAAVRKHYLNILQVARSAG
jgi:SAM-dependent methyltransferase